MFTFSDMSYILPCKYQSSFFVVYISADSGNEFESGQVNVAVKYLLQIESSTIGCDLPIIVQIYSNLLMQEGSAGIKQCTYKSFNLFTVHRDLFRHRLDIFCQCMHVYSK